MVIWAGSDDIVERWILVKFQNGLFDAGRRMGVFDR